MDLVKREENSLVPINPMMPFVPQILANAMPAPVPQMQFNSGIVTNFFHNVKLGQLAKASSAEAEIAENKRRYVESSLSMVENIVTFSGRLEVAFKRIKSEEAEMIINGQKAQAELVELQLKNMLLQNEVKLSELELKLKTKEMEELLNGSEQVEDRHR